jgi:mannose-6-phosphate isomerase-like protein (cupin superfamily)
MIRKADEMKKEFRDNMRGGAGRVAFRHYFAKEEFGANVRLCAKLTLPPGASIGPHEHDGEDEVYIVTGGSGLLDDGVTKTRISVGDSVLTGKGAAHAVENDGKEDLDIIAVIMCYAPAP